MKKFVRLLIFILSSSLFFSTFAGELSTFGDVLFWHASEKTGTTWANVTTLPSPDVTDYLEPNTTFNWHPGLRFGLMYQPSCQFWDSRITWTYFSSKANDTHQFGDQLVVSQFFSGFYFFSGDAFFGGDVSWQLTLNTLDYEASHAITLRDCFTLRPFIGVKAASIRQHISLNWDAVIYQSKENLKNNFLGLGPSFGIDTKWQFCPSLSLINNLSAAFLWGNWKIEDAYSRPTALLGLIEAHDVKTHMTNLQLGTMMLDYFLGLEWIHKGRSSVSIQLGYEMQYWPNQLRLPTFQQIPLHTDLTLQGGTCRIIIDL